MTLILAASWLVGWLTCQLKFKFKKPASVGLLLPSVPDWRSVFHTFLVLVSVSGTIIFVLHFSLGVCLSFPLCSIYQSLYHSIATTSTSTSTSTTTST
jgi:hypothetical protein